VVVAENLKARGFHYPFPRRSAGAVKDGDDYRVIPAPVESSLSSVAVIPTRCAASNYGAQLRT
jgi:hypothetical protein